MSLSQTATATISPAGWEVELQHRQCIMAKQFVCTRILTVLTQAQIQKQYPNKDAKWNAELKQLIYHTSAKTRKCGGFRTSAFYKKAHNKSAARIIRTVQYHFALLQSFDTDDSVPRELADPCIRLDQGIAIECLPIPNCRTKAMHILTFSPCLSPTPSSSPSLRHAHIGTQTQEQITYFVLTIYVS